MKHLNAKYREVAGIIERRIACGDYVLSGLQSDREIAAEFSIARPTARQALRLLVERGHILRKSNGRLSLPGEIGVPTPTRQIAFLAPAYPSPFIQRMRLAADRSATALGFVFRPVDYLHWTDRVVHEALSSFDGVILIPPSGMSADEVVTRLDKARAGVLCLGRDISTMGQPCLITNPPAGTQTLCDHLAGLGHRRIDCLNAHPPSTGIEQRLQQWQIWRTAHDIPGRLHDRRLAPFTDPLQAGYAFMRELLAAGSIDATAVLCTSELSTIGAYRAIDEAGLVIGRARSLCTFGGDGMCRYLSPSLTNLEPMDPAPLLQVWCEWIGRGRDGWIGPLRLVQSDLLFHGESTAPPGGWPAGQHRRSGPALPGQPILLASA
jgi:DNA-binding LacI/PurR family transcriptional regulator